jgi:hypothetical protein
MLIMESFFLLIKIFITFHNTTILIILFLNFRFILKHRISFAYWDINHAHIFLIHIQIINILTFGINNLINIII